MNVILGGGLAGLSAGCRLTQSGKKTVVLDKDDSVGGLSKTIEDGGFKFDLGGHRFITKNQEVMEFVKNLLADDLLAVRRKSGIYMKGRFFDYPLNPLNVVAGLGTGTTLRIIADYMKRDANGNGKKEIVSLEDWVVSRFGRKMFDLYFKDYSEKVWGTGCGNISKEWVEQRINGLSMWATVKNAFFKFSGKNIDTLADSFIYPKYGIGQIAEKMKEEISRSGNVLTKTSVDRVYHKDFHVKYVTAQNCRESYRFEGGSFVSSIPLTKLIESLSPAAPEDIIEAARMLRYRDMVIVTVMLNRERVTDLTWMYLPEKKIPIGRIHEPKNWSAEMAPEGKTHVVAEYFVFKEDETWRLTDAQLTERTVGNLSKLGFIQKKDVIGSRVVRVEKAYPIFEVGYEKHYGKIMAYLENFKNLSVIGRGGSFRYLNMDHAIESGLKAASAIIESGEKRNLTAQPVVV